MLARETRRRAHAEALRNKRKAEKAEKARKRKQQPKLEEGEVVQPKVLRTVCKPQEPDVDMGEVTVGGPGLSHQWM